MSVAANSTIEYGFSDYVDAARNLLNHIGTFREFAPNDRVSGTAVKVGLEINRVLDAVDSNTRGIQYGDLARLLEKVGQAFLSLLAVCRETEFMDWRAVVARRNMEDSFRNFEKIALQ